MSPLLIEGPECGHCWRTGDGIAHRCVEIPGHTYACQCFCGVLVASHRPPSAAIPPPAAGASPASGEPPG